jgi:endonuclease YncB( thermonuclease family)
MIDMRCFFKVILCVAMIITNLAITYAGNADNLTLDGRTYRLDGIDAPEIDQTCIGREGEAYPCGRAAAQARNEFIAGRTVHCDDLGPDRAYPNWRIGRCSVAETDLNRWLVKEGWAINLEPDAKGRFKGDEDDARAGRLGMWKGCFVAPQDFQRQNKRTAQLLGSNCPPDAREKLFPAEVRMPPGCEIKGKYALRALPYRGTYHVPGCRSYGRTRKPDRWFCSEEDARSAGFRRSLTCRRR